MPSNHRVIKQVIDMLKASISRSVSPNSYANLPHSNLSYIFPRGYCSVDIAIAYYDNGWISKGWNSLFMNLDTDPIIDKNFTKSIVLLDQPLQERKYYFYARKHEENLKTGNILPFISHADKTYHYGISNKNSQPADDCFWLEDENFYRNNAKYYGEGGLIRIGGNLFLGNKWTPDWHVVDVGDAYDYTIEFQLHLSILYHSHHHYPHPHSHFH